MTPRQIGRVTVLTNPASGHGNAPHAAEKAIARLQQRGIDVVAIVGSDAEHARRLLHAAVDKGTDALVVVGGDGVITDALQALATGLTGSSPSSYVELMWYGENLAASSSPQGSVNLFSTGTTARTPRRRPATVIATARHFSQDASRNPAVGSVAAALLTTAPPSGSSQPAT